MHSFFLHRDMSASLFGEFLGALAAGTISAPTRRTGESEVDFSEPPASRVRTSAESFPSASDVGGALAVVAAGRLLAHASSRLGLGGTHASTGGASSSTASQPFESLARSLGSAAVALAAGQVVATASSRPQIGVAIREHSQQLGYGAARANGRGERRSSAPGPYSSSTLIPIPRQPSPGTRVSRVSQLPVHALTADEVRALGPDLKECTVCMTAFQPGDELMTLPCFHRFHCECAGPWFERSQECPVCRHSIADV